MSPELSLAPEPEQSQDRMDTCSQGTLDELLMFIPEGWGYFSDIGHNCGVMFCGF